MTQRTYTPNPVPDENLTVLPVPYAPQRKGFFLSHMIRAAQSSALARLNVVPGNVWHRLLSIFAEALERQSHLAAATGVWALREGAYRAWYRADLFPARAPATYARGTVLLSLPVGSAESDLIPAGTLLGAPDGRTAEVESDTLFPAGSTLTVVQVVSTTPGSAGRFDAGMLTQVLGGRTRYTVSQPAPIAGGSDEENDVSVYTRFQDRVEASATGNRLAVYSAAKNARVLSGTTLVEQVRDCALIYPWAIPGMNGELGTGYAVIDNGSGDASEALVAAAQGNINLVQSVMERTTVVRASAMVVRPSIRAYATRTADPVAVEAALRKVWNDYADGLLIEDGLGRGRMSLYDLGQRLDRAHPDVLQTVFLNQDGDLIPPMTSRIVAGEMTIDLRRGEVFRPWA